MEKLFQELAEIIAPIAECEVDEVQPDTNLPNDLEIDSLRGLEIMVMVERKYKVKLSEEDLPKMTTPRVIAEMLAPHLKPVTA